MGLGRQRKRGELTPGCFAAVVVLGGAWGNVLLWEVGQGFQKGAEASVGVVRTGLEGVDSGFQAVALLGDDGHIAALAFSEAKLLRKRVALGLEGFDLGDGGATLGVERGEAGEQGGVGPAQTKPFLHPREVCAHKA